MNFKTLLLIASLFAVNVQTLMHAAEPGNTTYKTKKEVPAAAHWKAVQGALGTAILAASAGMTAYIYNWHKAKLMKESSPAITFSTGAILCHPYNLANWLLCSLGLCIIASEPGSTAISNATTKATALFKKYTANIKK